MTTKKQHQEGAAQSPKVAIHRNGPKLPKGLAASTAKSARKAQTKKKNPEFIDIDGQQVRLNDLLADYHRLLAAPAESKKARRKACKYRREKALKPYQAELIQMQAYLEQQKNHLEQLSKYY